MLTVMSTVPGGCGGVITRSAVESPPFIVANELSKVTVVGQGRRQCTVGNRFSPERVMTVPPDVDPKPRETFLTIGVFSTAAAGIAARRRRAKRARRMGCFLKG